MGGQTWSLPARQLHRHFLHAAGATTVELGLGEDAAAEAESVLPVADVEGGDWRVMGHLQKDTAGGTCPCKPSAWLTSQLKARYLLPDVKCFAVGLLVQPHAAEGLSYDGVVRLLQSLWGDGTLLKCSLPYKTLHS